MSVLLWWSEIFQPYRHFSISCSGRDSGSLFWPSKALLWTFVVCIQSLKCNTLSIGQTVNFLEKSSCVWCKPCLRHPTESSLPLWEVSSSCLLWIKHGKGLWPSLTRKLYLHVWIQVVSSNGVLLFWCHHCHLRPRFAALSTGFHDSWGVYK